MKKTIISISITTVLFALTLMFFLAHMLFIGIIISPITEAFDRFWSDFTFFSCSTIFNFLLFLLPAKLILKKIPIYYYLLSIGYALIITYTMSIIQ